VKVQPPAWPTAEWDYDHPDYLDPAKLEHELRRVGEICHQCRRCLPLCPAFPRLFELVDAQEGEIGRVALRDLDEVNELCFHCKQCWNHCPYTPPHEWDVDFPGLMRRHQLARARRDGIPWLRRLTTRTDLLGTLGRAAPPLVNAANRNRLSRVLLEKTAGIHRDWVQPTYHAETLDRWFARREPRSTGENGRAALFATCMVNYSDPPTGRAAVVVLEHAGVAVDVVYERCCGMPFTDVGDLESARRNAARNVGDLLPQVEAGAAIVVPGPSCSLMLREEYPKLLKTRAARRVAEATRDLMEYVYGLAKARHLRKELRHELGRVAYHAPCHLRHQGVGFRGRDLLRWAGAEVGLVDACSGVDGTWGMQARFHDASMKDRLPPGRPADPGGPGPHRPAPGGPARPRLRPLGGAPRVNPLVLEDIADRHRYESVREVYRQRIIDLKHRRRLAVGDRITLVFENRETLRFQVQEMARVEKIDSPEALQHELDVYNELLPAECELSATLFIEIPDLDSIRTELDRLIGIDEQVFLDVGEEAIQATFDPKQMQEDRISAVQYVRFRLAPAQRERFADPRAPLRVRIEHPEYRAEAALSERMRETLLADLHGECPVLLPEEALPPRDADPELVEQGGRIRVVRAGPTHLVVEPRQALPRGVLLAGDDETLALETLRTLERLARELRSAHGGVEIRVEVGGHRPRWHLVGGSP